MASSSPPFITQIQSDNLVRARCRLLLNFEEIHDTTGEQSSFFIDTTELDYVC